ncbi:MAG: hypothetical protein K2Y37_01200 [Pirellulales bacterium]|nr:hypothetical protein [Pirellulales bacterium]
MTLDVAAYERLKTVAEGHDPPLSLTYVAQYAVKLFLKRLDDPQRLLEFKEQTQRDTEDG